MITEDEAREKAKQIAFKRTNPIIRSMLPSMSRTVAFLEFESALNELSSWIFKKLKQKTKSRKVKSKVETEK